MAHTFVGFGFGPIQAGLFLTEAWLSHNFDRLVVAEVLPDVVAAVRAAGGFAVNIAHTDSVAVLRVRPVEIYQPQVESERAELVAAVAAAEELATALPSVDFYDRNGAPGSVAAIMAAGLRRKAAAGGPPAVVYAAENNTQAAHLLRAAVLAHVPLDEQAAVLATVQFLDTIIGKMSGAPAELNDLAPVAPGLARAFLVEAFNRILIEQILRPGPAWTNFRRGIEVFVEKADLEPFAQAKLYGHNAGHALAAYLGHQLGLTRIDQLAERPDVLNFVRAAMLEESGAPLCRRYAAVDSMFTHAGFRSFADDLVARMVNPYMRDSIARVGRDPARKLAWDDRLTGAMRLAITGGVRPYRYATGAAAALMWLNVPAAEWPAYLHDLWAVDSPDGALAEQISAEIAGAGDRLRAWRAAGFPPLEIGETGEVQYE